MPQTAIVLLAFAAVGARAFALTSLTPSFRLLQKRSLSSPPRHVPLYSSEPTYDDSSGTPIISQVDVLYQSRSPLVYDEALERYVPATTNQEDSSRLTAISNNNNKNTNHSWRRSILFRLKHAFLPEGVTSSYYRFSAWRILQRFINANVHVFGTTSLLMGLGLKNHNIGLSAALNWVLKDALGKGVRMTWAAKMGRKFDSDAKRWRFRSSLVFALGNALEIITYVLPSLFLLWATLANCCKQISMLTSSSTRSAIYNSFRLGGRENLGDITAKGEAQIAVVDLVGIASGVALSKLVGPRVRNILMVFIILQACELFCLYHEIRAVEFKVLNFERLVQLVTCFIIQQPDEQPLPTPQEMAKTEKIFLPPQHLCRRAIAFGSVGRAKLSPDELQDLMLLFQKEKFLLVVGPNVKNANHRRLFLSPQDYPPPQEQCHIVLHVNATNVDIVKSTLALCLLRTSLAQNDDKDVCLRTSESMKLLKASYEQADAMFPSLLKSMQVAGWAPPARFMFGRVTMRAEWPLQAYPQVIQTPLVNLKRVEHAAVNGSTSHNATKTITTSSSMESIKQDTAATKASNS